MPIILYKPVSETPLETVQRYRAKHQELNSKPIGYAGRLDPMAEGLLLLLVGDENKKRKEFEDFDKEYEFEIFFGFETDSYDLMGIITNEQRRVKREQIKARLPGKMKALVGTWNQAYPPYSSAAVAGKPLYWWTRRNRLGEISIPTKEITVKELEVSRWRDAHVADVAHEAIQRIEKVNGDFRQEEIIVQWQTIAKLHTRVELPLATCRVVCSSGTYVRGLAHSLGRSLKMPALAYSINRVRIGQFEI